MFKNHMVRDLSLLSLIKIGLIAVIYYALFAPYDGKPADLGIHLLGPVPAPLTKNQG
jgi:hypothetical protein